MNLTSSDIVSIANAFTHYETASPYPIKSISLSYNPLIGDAGIIAILKHLPKSITEIGFVNCGITDIGGIEILKWMNKAPQLRMICMEGNEFSAGMKMRFGEYKIENPGGVVVY